MKLLSNAKINFGLRVLDKRKDGFHNIESILVPIALSDEITIEKSPEFAFSSSGICISSECNVNLCERAYKLLLMDFEIPPVSIHLHKNIPVGSGLGGGSSNAVATLKALDWLFELKLNREQMLSYSSQLGSDCPFFVDNKISLVTGRGELLEKSSLDLAGLDIFVVYPNISISTAVAFQKVKPSRRGFSLRNIRSLKREQWQENINNAFSEVIFKANPQIAEIQHQFLENGAVYSSMSGSGSAVYAFFPKGEIPLIDWPSTYFVWTSDNF